MYDLKIAELTREAATWRQCAHDCRSILRREGFNRLATRALDLAAQLRADDRAREVEAQADDRQDALDHRAAMAARWMNRVSVVDARRKGRNANG